MKFVFVHLRDKGILFSCKLNVDIAVLSSMDPGFGVLFFFFSFSYACCSFSFKQYGFQQYIYQSFD